MPDRRSNAAAFRARRNVRQRFATMRGATRTAMTSVDHPSHATPSAMPAAVPPARPSLIYAVNPKEYIRRVRMESLGRHVPRADARWIGELLSRLSPAHPR